MIPAFFYFDRHEVALNFVISNLGFFGFLEFYHGGIFRNVNISWKCVCRVHDTLKFGHPWLFRFVRILDELTVERGVKLFVFEKCRIWVLLVTARARIFTEEVPPVHFVHDLLRACQKQIFKRFESLLISNHRHNVET